MPRAWTLWLVNIPRALCLLVGCGQWELPEAGETPSNLTFFLTLPTVLYVLKSSHCCYGSHHPTWVPAFCPHLCKCSLSELPAGPPDVAWPRQLRETGGLNECSSEMLGMWPRTSELQSSSLLTASYYFLPSPWDSLVCDKCSAASEGKRVTLCSIATLMGTEHGVSRAEFCQLKSVW